MTEELSKNLEAESAQRAKATERILNIRAQEHNFVQKIKKTKIPFRDSFLPFASDSEKKQWGVLYYNVTHFKAETDKTLRNVLDAFAKSPGKTNIEEFYKDFLKKYDKAEEEFNRLDTLVAWLETKYADKINKVEAEDKIKKDKTVELSSTLSFLKAIDDPYLMQDYIDDFEFRTGKKSKSNLSILIETEAVERDILQARQGNLQAFKTDFYLRTSQSKSLPKISDLPFPMDLSFPKLKSLHSEITTLELPLKKGDVRKTFLRSIKKEIELKIEQTKELQKASDWKQTLSTVSFAVAAVASGALNFIGMLAAVPVLNTIANPIKQILSFIGYSFWGIATKEDKSLTTAEKEILAEHYSFMRKATLGSAATGFLGAGALITSVFLAATLPWSLLVGTALLTISNFAWMATTIKDLKHEIDHSKADASRTARITGHVFNVIYAFTSTIGVALLALGAIALAFSPPGLMALAGVLAIAALVTLGTCIASFLASKASFYVASRQASFEENQRLSKEPLDNNRLQNQAENDYEHSQNSRVTVKPSLAAAPISPEVLPEETVKFKKKSLRSFNNLTPLQGISRGSDRWSAISSRLSTETYHHLCTKLENTITLQSDKIDSPYYQCKVLKEPSSHKSSEEMTFLIPNLKNGQDRLITKWTEDPKKSHLIAKQGSEEVKPELQITLSKRSDDRAIFFMMENFSTAVPLQLGVVNEPKIVLKLLEAAKASGWDIQNDPTKSALKIDISDHQAIIQDPTLAKQYKAILDMNSEDLKGMYKQGKKLGEDLVDREVTSLLKPE